MALDFQGISTQRKFGQSRLDIQPGLAQQAKLDNDARAVKNAVLEQKRTERLGRRAYRAALRGQDPTRYIQGIDALEKMRAIHGSSGAGINIAGSQEQGLSTHIGNTRTQLDAFNAFKRDLGNSELIRSGDEGALSRAVKRGAELGMSPGEVRELAGVGPRQAGASQFPPATTTTPAATDFDKDGNGVPDSFQASRVPIGSSPSATKPSGQVTYPDINTPQPATYEAVSDSTPLDPNNPPATPPSALLSSVLRSVSALKAAKEAAGEMEARSASLPSRLAAGRDTATKMAEFDIANTNAERDRSSALKLRAGLAANQAAFIEQRRLSADYFDRSISGMESDFAKDSMLKRAFSDASPSIRENVPQVDYEAFGSKFAANPAAFSHLTQSLLAQQNARSASQDVRLSALRSLLQRQSAEVEKGLGGQFLSVAGGLLNRLRNFSIPSPSAYPNNPL